MTEQAVPAITRITAIRHGETAWNAQARLQGHLDIELNAAGRQQALQTGLALASEQIDAVISSDLSRARETAQAVAAHHRLAVQTDSGLRERGFGCLQGMTYTEIEAQMPEQALLWRKRDLHFAPEGGESLMVFRERIVRCLRTWATQHAGKHLVLVCHGGVLDILYREATGLDLQAARTWQLGNASINRLLWNGEHLSLVGWSDVRHLDAGLDEQHA